MLEWYGPWRFSGGGARRSEESHRVLRVSLCWGRRSKSTFNVLSILSQLCDHLLPVTLCQTRPYRKDTQNMCFWKIFVWISCKYPSETTCDHTFFTCHRMLHMSSSEFLHVIPWVKHKFYTHVKFMCLFCNSFTIYFHCMEKQSFRTVI